MLMNKYKIHIEDGAIIVTLFGDESIRVFYFDAGNDEEGTAQEMYDLLFSTGVDVDDWEG
jgi:hypothetical protein